MSDPHWDNLKEIFHEALTLPPQQRADHAPQTRRQISPITKLQTGDVATDDALQSDLRTRWVTKFIFGINMPVRQFVKALGGSK